MLSTTIVAAIIVLFAFSAMCTSASAATDEEIEEAIANGTAWLASQQNSDGSWGDWDSVARTGFAVVKFATHATMADPAIDPFNSSYEYSDEVIGGLNYIFANANIIDIDLQPAGDPDTNGNGTGVYFGGTYQTGIAMMAIAASADPDRVVNVPGSPVNGWTYKDVLQDAVDYMAWGQTDTGYGQGGWDYSYHDDSGSRSDNSITGYAVLGLGYAQADPPHGLGCTVPAFVKDELNIWIDYIQNDVDGDTDDGGSGYTDPNDGWVNILKTGNLLYEMGFYGDIESTPRVQNATDYLCRHWDDANQDPGWKGTTTPHYQATYTTMKGLEVFLIPEICNPPIDWFDEMSTAIVTTQNADGSWPSDNWGDSMLATEWALLTLQRAVAPLISPVVSDIPDECVLAGDSFATINLDAYVEDGDNEDSEITWATSGEADLTVDIDANRVATITYTAGWTGSETITFTATDPDSQSDSDDATFTVAPVPVVGDIPDQTAPFVSFDLDDYLSGIDSAEVTWSASGTTCLVVSIDGDSVVTVTNPGGCTDPETVTFTATANACSGVVSDSDDATFIPNRPPVADAGPDQTVEQAYYQGGDVILDGSGSSDPDNDPLTYKWTWDGKSATGVSPTVSLPLGRTTITLVVNDGIVDSAPDIVNITVQDTTPPTVIITDPSDAAEIWYRETIDVEYTVSDICDSSPTVVVTPPDPIPAPLTLGTLPITVSATDASGNPGSDSVTVTVIGPMDLKEQAVRDLEAAKTGDKKTDKKIDDAIKHIQKSLEDKLWEDDELHLDTKHGKKVFDEEKKVVKDLTKLCKCKGIADMTLNYTGTSTVDIRAYNKDGTLIAEVLGASTGDGIFVDGTTLPKGKLGTETTVKIFDNATGTLTDTQKIHTSCSKPLDEGMTFGDLEVTEVSKIVDLQVAVCPTSDIIKKLVQADEGLAKTALDDAKGTTVADPKKQDKINKEIAKAEEELVKAEDELNKGKPDKAIDHYKKAWEHAQKAIKHAQK